MAQVRDAIPFSWRNCFKYLKYKKKLNKFIRSLDEGSPSFGVLWNFADFIKYSEFVFFYDNCKTSNLFSSIGYAPGENGFKISEEDYTIIVKLFSDSQRVGIDIENKKGNKLKKNYTFEKNEWIEEPDEYDILFIDRIISIINRHMITMLNDCIKKKLA